MEYKHRNEEIEASKPTPTIKKEYREVPRSLY
jgi:hypothetical protein